MQITGVMIKKSELIDIIRKYLTEQKNIEIISDAVGEIESYDDQLEEIYFKFDSN